MRSRSAFGVGNAPLSGATVARVYLGRHAYWVLLPTPMRAVTSRKPRRGPAPQQQSEPPMYEDLPPGRLSTAEDEKWLEDFKTRLWNIRRVAAGLAPWPTDPKWDGPE